MMKRFFLKILAITSLITLLLIGGSELFSGGGVNQDVPAVDSSLAVRNLGNEIDKLLSFKKSGRTRSSVAVYSFNSGNYLYKNNYESTLVPASNTKLATTFAAFSLLGYDYKMRTKVIADAIPDKQGIINGNVYLIGGGNALLTINEIENLAEIISRNGIREIKGNICGDDSFFDNIYNRIDYSGDRDIVEPIPPVCGLSIEKNMATILVKSSSAPGKKVWAQVLPASEAFRIIINAKTTGSVPKKGIKSIQKKPTKKMIKRKKKIYGDFLSAKNIKDKKSYSPGGISVSTRIGEDGIQEFIINGSLAKNRTVSYVHFIKNPALVCAGALKERLEAGGISIGGRIIKQALNRNAQEMVILAETNRQLFDILYLINKNSDNFLAENVFKLLGASSGNNGNCAESARSMIFEALNKYGVFFDGVKLNDGSGLSRRNLLTTRTLAEILIKSREQPFFNYFDSTLSIAGTDGTLKNRFCGTAAYHNLAGKTGTHSNVSSLSGYVMSSGGDVLAFSMIFNGSGNFKSIENKIGALLSEFDYKTYSELK